MRLPVDNAVITSPYGDRILNGKKQFHDGIDIVSRERATVYSIADGRVSYDMDNYNDALRWVDQHMSAGNMVIIDYVFPDGELYHIRFLHLLENIVSVGDAVIEGEVIGEYADVGYSFGAHLHNDAYDKNWKKINIQELYQANGLL